MPSAGATQQRSGELTRRKSSVHPASSPQPAAGGYSTAKSPRHSNSQQRQGFASPRASLLGGGSPATSRSHRPSISETVTFSPNNNSSVGGGGGDHHHNVRSGGSRGSVVSRATSPGPQQRSNSVAPADQQKDEAMEHLWDRYNRIHGKVLENTSRLEAQTNQLRVLETRHSKESSSQEHELGTQTLELTLLREELTAKKDRLATRLQDSEKYSSGLAEMQRGLQELKQQMALAFVSKTGHLEYCVEESLAKERAASMKALQWQNEESRLIFGATASASSAMMAGSASSDYYRTTAAGGGKGAAASASLTAYPRQGGGGDDPLCDTAAPSLSFNGADAAKRLPEFLPMRSTMSYKQNLSSSPPEQNNSKLTPAGSSRQDAIDVGLLSMDTVGGFSTAAVGATSTRDSNPLNVSSDQFARGIEAYDVIDLKEQERRVLAQARDRNLIPANNSMSLLMGISSPISPIVLQCGDAASAQVQGISQTVRHSFQAIHQLQLEFAPTGSRHEARGSDGRVSPAPAGGGGGGGGPFSNDSFAPGLPPPSGGFQSDVRTGSISPTTTGGPAWLNHNAATALLRRHNQRFDDVVVDWINDDAKHTRPATPTFDSVEDVQLFPHSKFV